MHSNIIIETIFKAIDFTADEVKQISSVFNKINVKKGEVLYGPNDIVDTQYYIIKGCLRTFYLDNQGKEYTVQFGVSDWWISDYTAYFASERAKMTVEAIQDSTLYKISRKDQEKLFVEIPSIERFFREKLERAFAAFQKRIIAGLSQPAKERYIQFIKTYPNIEKSVKNYHIASYLGITTESLSRIRKEL